MPHSDASWQPGEQVCRVATALQGGRGKQYKKMRTRLDTPNYHLLEVAAGNTIEINEYIVAMAGQIIEDHVRRPRGSEAAIADKDGFVNTFHIGCGLRPAHTDDCPLRPHKFSTSIWRPLDGLGGLSV